MTRLTTKQHNFIVACNYRMQDGYTADFKPNYREIPFLFGPMQWDDWGFRSKSDAESFAQRLLDRGLISTDKQWFFRISDKGRAAIAGAKE